MNYIKNPAALAGANRAQEVITLLGVDVREPTEIENESLPVRLVSHRYHLSISRARTVCFLAGIGGEA